MKKLKNKLILTSVIATACVFLYSSQSAQSVVLTNEDSSIITSNSQAYKEVSPDTAHVIFSVITEDKHAKVASVENSKKSNKVLGAIKLLLGENETVKTTNFSLNPYSEYDRIQKKHVQKGYRVNNQVKVKVKNLEILSDLIDTAIQNGANKVDSLNFSIEDTTDVCNQLLIEASQKAKAKAETITQALNVKIGGIKRISSSCSSGNVYNRRVYAYEAVGGLGSPKAASTPIETGEIKLNASVNIDFRIKN